MHVRMMVVQEPQVVSVLFDPFRVRAGVVRALNGRIGDFTCAQPVGRLQSVLGFLVGRFRIPFL